MIGSRSHPAWFVLAATEIVLAWLILRNAAQGTTNPAQVEAFWPASGAALAGDARARIVAAGGRVDTHARALIRTALLRSPAADAPLVLAGFAAGEDGDLRRARALMTAAVMRNPRNDAARYWLLDHAFRTGDYAAGMAQIGPALRLRDGTREPIFALIAGVLAIPAAATAVRTTLATDPDWRADFFRTQATAGTDPATLATLLLALPRSPHPETARVEQRAVVYAAIDHGRFARAHETWRALLPADSPPQTTTLYDPSFDGLSGTPPFNWSFQPDGATSATLVAAAGPPRHSALAITYPGTDTAVIVEQYALVRPGTYALSVRGRRVGDSVDARVAVRVRCASDDALLSKITVPDHPTTTRRTAPVMVPPGCAAVRVQFVGEPGASVGVVRVLIDAVHLDPR